MSPQKITYIAVFCLLFIFATQAFLVYDYFQTTRDGLIRESDAILEEAFRIELNQRIDFYKISIGEDTISVPPPHTEGNTVSFDMRHAVKEDESVVRQLDYTLNEFVEVYFPLNIRNLDSITNNILSSRNINSKFLVKIIEPFSAKVLEQSSENHRLTILMVSSKYFSTDLEGKKVLQLTLINPFGIILKRMGLMLISSLLLSIICLLAFRYLQKILARQKQLVAFKNEFLSTIAHELKRPVASLSFNLDCMTLPALSKNPQKQSLLIQNSISATTELNATINMIVALAKLEEGLLQLNKERINLKQLFEELKTRFVYLAHKKVEIKIQYETNELTYSGDLNLLTQCFANLIDNAIKYSNNEVLVIININKADSWLVVSISDNGFGIPEEKLPMIFDKYTRAHTENNKINGFGIGLNYVKSIVETHHGQVAVKSEIGKGTEFRVMLRE